MYNTTSHKSLLPEQTLVDLLTKQKGVMAIQFGSDLRKMRKRAGMSQEEIALELHMSISNVSRLETDKYELKAADLLRWASATNAMDMLLALVIGVDIALVQQILEMISSSVATVLLSIF